MKYLLLIPGPVEAPDEIIEAFNGQTVAHYGKDFRDLYIDTAQRLSRILGTSGSSFLVPGSGTSALEMIGANFCRSKKCLIINNGHFGERIFEVASRHSTQVDQVTFHSGQAYDLGTIEDYLFKGKYDLVWMVHVDTSTGILNPLEEVSKLCKKYNTRLFVDAIASSGLENIKMDDWGISGIANASQKGFSCPAGFGLLTLSVDLLNNLDNFEKAQTWFSDIRVWIDYYEKWNDWHPYPVSLPCNLVKALNKSFEIIEEEGIEKRVLMFEDISNRMVASIRHLGLDLFVPQGYQAHGLTAVTTLGKFNAVDFIDFLREKFQIQIGGSLDKKTKPFVFRIGHMSTKQSQTKNMVSVISALGAYMRIQGLHPHIDQAISIFVE